MRKTFLKLIPFLFAFSLLATSCQKEVVSDTVGSESITFKSNIIPNPLRVANDQWELNDQIKLFMLRSGKTLSSATATSDILYDGVTFKTKSAGAKVSFEANSDADKMFFPESGSVDFVAYYPASLDAGSERAFTLNVATNPVDILYSNNAKGKSKTSTQSDMLLTFRHALSTLRVTLLDASNNPITAGATVKVQGINTEGKLQLADGSISDLANKTTLDLKLEGNNFDAIVLPQQVAAGEVKLVITYDGKNFTYNLPATDFIQGKRILYKLTLKDASVPVEGEASITPWEEVDGGEITLTPDNGTPAVSSFSTSLTSPELSFDATGGTETFTVTTDATSFTATSSQTWLTAAIETATGKVTVTATPNETTADREATLTLKHSGVLRSAPETIVITVKQKGKKAGGGTTPAEAWDGGISALREAFEAGNTTIAQETKIQGILINDPVRNMNSHLNVIISDGKAGIMVRMADGNGLTEGEYAPGDQIEITIPSGTSMLRYMGGSVQIQGIKKTDMQKVEKKHTIEPIEVTFAELMTDKIKGELESRLVKLSGVQFVTTTDQFTISKTKYHELQEDSSSAPIGEFGLPSVGASQTKHNKLGITTKPEGNGTIIGATLFSSVKGKPTCSIWIRTADELQFTNPRK